MNRRECSSPTLYRTKVSSGSTRSEPTSTPRQPVMKVSFTIPGKPVGKQRSRSARLPNGGVRHYTPDETVRYENLVALAAKIAMAGADPTSSAVWLDLTVILTVPKSWGKRNTEAALSGDIKPTSKPDLSNVIKAVEDGMNGVVYQDDSQITHLTASKRYGSAAGVHVSVRW